MKPLLAAAFVLLAAPPLAHAGATITMRDVPLHGARSLAAASPARFDLVGLHWRGPGSVVFRTRSISGRWSAWRTAAPEAEDQPDAGTSEAAAAHGWRLGNPYWVGASDRIAYRLRGRVARLRAYFVWSPVDALPPRRLSIAGSPPIIARSAWGANESIRRAAPRYADSVSFALVHHTAGTNSYSRSQSAAIVRGIEVYHVQGNGWNDIGYNFLVDRYGQVFEGRFGGVDKNVIGAHALGFNTGSTGVAVIGSYDSAPPPAVAQAALVSVLAWRLDVAHVDPASTVTAMSGGNPRYPPGTPVFLRAISGHRDTGPTTCPGNALYARLGAIAAGVGTTGLPKLYSPSAKGNLGAPIEFRAQLTSDLPWTVTVSDASGQVVASGSGSGTSVDWIWDSSGVPPGRYGWAIDAGPTIRPATGFVGAAPKPLALTRFSASPPTISPNGDGVKDTAKVSYTLSVAATVTAALRASSGLQLATLFSDRRKAGKHAFTFGADGVADGRYDILLTASDGRTAATAIVPVTVDRTVGALSLAPSAISPNGDGRNDELTVSLRLARPANLQLEVRRGSRLAAAIFGGDAGAGPQSVSWDGLTDRGRAADGRYNAVVASTSELGRTVYSLPFRIDTVAPVVRAVSFRRLVFRISEPARVRLVVDGRTYVRSVRAGAFSLRLQRVARRVRLFATDAAGNVSRTLRSP
jgi:hypothetical protein